MVVFGSLNFSPRVSNVLKVIAHGLLLVDGSHFKVLYLAAREAHRTKISNRILHLHHPGPSLSHKYAFHLSSLLLDSQITLCSSQFKVSTRSELYLVKIKGCESKHNQNEHHDISFRPAGANVFNTQSPSGQTVVL